MSAKLKVFPLVLIFVIMAKGTTTWLYISCIFMEAWQKAAHLKKWERIQHQGCAAAIFNQSNMLTLLKTK